jgi:hypothetical protein
MDGREHLLGRRGHPRRVHLVDVVVGKELVEGHAGPF